MALLVKMLRLSVVRCSSKGSTQSVAESKCCLLLFISISRSIVPSFGSFRNRNVLVKSCEQNVFYCPCSAPAATD